MFETTLLSIGTRANSSSGEKYHPNMLRIVLYPGPNENSAPLSSPQNLCPQFLSLLQSLSTVRFKHCFISFVRDYCSASPQETLAPPLYFETAKWALTLGAPLGCPSLQVDHLKNKNAIHDPIRWLKCAGIVLAPSRWSQFVYDREITVTDADAGPALMTLPMQEIQYFIMRFMELLTGRNAFAIDFWTNPIAQAQIRDFKARTLHATEVTRHAEVPPHKILNNAANSRMDGYTQNLQFQILMLYKLTILSIQHVLETNTKKTLIDLMDMCAALLRFAEWSTYIRIQMKGGAQGPQQLDPGNNGVMSHAIQQLHALRLIQGQRIQDMVSPQTGHYSATAMGYGQTIPQLVTPMVRQAFQGFDMQLSIIDSLPQFMQSSQTFGVQQTQQSNLLTPPAPSTAGHPTFLIKHPELELCVTKITIQSTTRNQTTDIGTTSIKPNFWAQRSYILRYLGIKASGEHHRRFGEGLLNVSTFFQRHARHEYQTVNYWQAFLREVNTDLYLETVRMELDEDDNYHYRHDRDHDHDHNHRNDKERIDCNDQLIQGRGRKRWEIPIIQNHASDNCCI
ncbi:MAG: hypothetical protein EZS28_017302 [Streblomastix strix]|uniref:Uncharacterized protein n=1 Tax=Streblomastix strix TaxID=222440 RepID=A0A5J4VXC9_9EUKA|nr:MAG: hypothetical protein EZS28_017302 [Streblomastix strix]